jgi:hypothetical protein
VGSAPGSSPKPAFVEGFERDVEQKVMPLDELAKR